MEPPTITWQYSDGKQIVNTSTTIISEIDVEWSFLTLTNVSSVYEFGPLLVKCVATNDFGTVMRNISKFYLVLNMYIYMYYIASGKATSTKFLLLGPD